MKIFRILGAVVVVVALVWSVARVSATTSTSPVAAQCSTAALSHAVNGAYRVMSVQSFGCADNFAFLWATVGTNEADAIGVTEVLRFSSSTQRWSLVSRLKYCHRTTLPTFIYLRGCFSN